MSKLPRVKPAKMITALGQAGFYVDHITGSHYILYKNDKTSPVSIPFHKKELKLGTLKSILKQARMPIEDLKKYL